MAVTVTGPIQEPGISLNRNKTGDTLTYSLDVTGLTSSGLAALKEALTATGVPAIGDADSVFTELKLATIVPSFLSADDAVRLALTFVGTSSVDSGGGSGGGEIQDGRRISFGSSLARVESNTNVDGGLVTVTYQGDEVLEASTQSGTFQTDVAINSFTVTLREDASPLEKAKEYTNKVNSDQVVLFGTTFYEGELLCTGISAETSDNVDTWDVSYQFDYADQSTGHNEDRHPSTFLTQPVYWRNVDGRVPADATSYNPATFRRTESTLGDANGGIVNVDIRLTNSFAALGIFDGSFETP